MNRSIVVEEPDVQGATIGEMQGELESEAVKTVLNRENFGLRGKFPYPLGEFTS